jgi:hypothetical protein
MSTMVRTPVVAVFEQRGQAISAIDELEHAGFIKDQIGVATPGGPLHEANTPTSRREENAAEGAAKGAITGGVAGAVSGALAAALIPGVGPILAGGFLAGILAGTVGGAAAGAALGGWFGPFVAMGVPQQDAERYRRELQEGRTLVVVKAGDRGEEAERILHDHGGRCE